MKKFLVALLATLSFAAFGGVSVNNADAYVGQLAAGQAQLSNGQVCVPGNGCQLILINESAHITSNPIGMGTLTQRTGLYTYWNSIYGWLDTTGTFYRNFWSDMFNAVSALYGDNITAYVRQACPGGGFHYSNFTHWPYPNIGLTSIIWMGVYRLGTGCQTLRAALSHARRA